MIDEMDVHGRNGVLLDESFVRLEWFVVVGEPIVCDDQDFNEHDPVCTLARLGDCCKMIVRSDTSSKDGIGAIADPDGRQAIARRCGVCVTTVGRHFVRGMVECCSEKSQCPIVFAE